MLLTHDPAQDWSTLGSGSGPAAGPGGLTGCPGWRTAQPPTAALSGSYDERLEWTPPPETRHGGDIMVME